MVAIAIVVAFYKCKVKAIVAAFSEYCRLHSVHCQILLTCLLDSCPPVWLPSAGPAPGRLCHD